MPRRPVLTPALAVVASTALLAGLAAPASALSRPAVPASASSLAMAPVVTADPSEADPLQLRIERMTPAVIDTPRAVTIAGTVTNTSDETWTGINIAPFQAQYPITDSLTLAAAAELPSDEYVGERLTQVEALHKVDSLEPGESAPFTTRIPRELLRTGAGVYWVGVHASGYTETQPRDDFTDGRARTFLPVSSDDVRPLRTSLVVPMRATVRHTADGRVDGVDSWVTLLGPGGRLSGLLDVAADAGSRPVSWLIDPAVPHAVSRLAAGNPGFTLTSVERRAKDGEKDEEEAPAKDQEPTLPVLPSPTAAPDAADPEYAAVAELATAWLERFREVFADADVLALPYGDLDASALTDTAPASLAAAHARSAQVLDAYGVTSRPAISSPDGFLSRSAVENAPESALVLLGERALTSDVGPLPTTGTVLGRDFAATSAGVSQGGPGPEPANTAIAVRQRTASEAVLRALAGDRSPVVLTPPNGWDAAAGAEQLFELLDSRRFRLASLTSTVESSNDVVAANSLVYTDVQRETEVPKEHVEASTALVARALTFESVLTRPAGLDVQVRDVAWTELAVQTRRRPGAALDRIEAVQDHLDDQLASITVSGPSSATMSGSSGNIGATVVNGLDVPVTVNVEVESSADLEVQVPNPVNLPPESRRRLLLETSAQREGVQTLTLRIADAEGRPLGDSTSVPIRVSEIGRLLWLMMGGGAVILFGAIAVRLFRRGLASRRDQGAV